MKIFKLDLAFALWAAHVHDRVERGERHAHIARMRRDTLVALTEYRMDPIVAVHRPATTFGCTLVTGRESWVVKIVTTCSLQQIAADRRHVAQLRTRSREEGRA